MLTSTSAAAKSEMDAFNTRLWRIMGVEEQTAHTHKLVPIAEFIDNACELTLNRLLADPNYPHNVELIAQPTTKCAFSFSNEKGVQSGLPLQLPAKVSTNASQRLK